MEDGEYFVIGFVLEAPSSKFRAVPISFEEVTEVLGNRKDGCCQPGSPEDSLAYFDF